MSGTLRDSKVRVKPEFEGLVEAGVCRAKGQELF